MRPGLDLKLEQHVRQWTWREPELCLVEELRARPGGVLHELRRVGAEQQCKAFSVERLLGLAERAAASLEAAGARRGDRVVIATRHVRLILTWYLACLGRGMIAVILPPGAGFGAKTRYDWLARGIIMDCSPRVVVRDDVRSQDVDGARALRFLDATAAEAGGHGIELVAQPLQSPAFLQYTSGSTTVPKGVVITHGNLVANLQAISCGLGVSSSERMVTWLPLHHDMGLVGGVLWPLFIERSTFVMNTLDFISSPVSWLRSIDAFAGTITVAPNFAYSLCVRKVREAELGTLSLRTVRLALCGAEVVDADVAAAFEERFAGRGFRRGVFHPVYGLAEATLAVAFPRVGAEIVVDRTDMGRTGAHQGNDQGGATRSRIQPIVSVGAALPGHSIAVRRAETGSPCVDHEVGEIFVSGPSVSPRYWSEPVETNRTSVATGDLGYVADGSLYVVGRLKDVIVVAGDKYSPTDIERAVTDVRGVRAGRAVAFGSRQPDAGTDVAVVVAEFNPRVWRRLAVVEADIVDAVRSRVGLNARVLLVAPGTVEKTTSGKLRRRACAARYEAGELVGIGALGGLWLRAFWWLRHVVGVGVSA